MVGCLVILILDYLLCKAWKMVPWVPDSFIFFWRESGTHRVGTRGLEIFHLHLFVAVIIVTVGGALNWGYYMIGSEDEAPGKIYEENPLFGLLWLKNTSPIMFQHSSKKPAPNPLLHFLQSPLLLGVNDPHPCPHPSPHH